MHKRMARGEPRRWVNAGRATQKRILFRGYGWGFNGRFRRWLGRRHVPLGQPTDDPNHGPALAQGGLQGIEAVALGGVLGHAFPLAESTERLFWPRGAETKAPAENRIPGLA